MVSIIIPTLNHFDYLKETLKYLYHNTDMEQNELIIIDDGSTDETKDELTSYLNYNYTVIRNWPVNIGFAPSVNKGIKAASGDYVAISNNDILVGPNWLDIIIQELERENYYMLTSYLVGVERCSDVSNFNEWARSESEARSLINPQVLLWDKGGPWVFKKEVFEKIGLFDEQFIYGTYEDTDFLMRMAKDKLLWGMKVDSVAFHYGSITQNGELQKRVGTDYKSINRERFIAKWGSSHITPAKLDALYRGEELVPDGL